MYVKTWVIQLVIHLNLHSQLFRVHCYCIDLDHILALVIVVLDVTFDTTVPTVCLHVIVNSCMKWLNLKRPWPLPDIRSFGRMYKISKHQTLNGASNLALLFYTQGAFNNITTIFVGSWIFHATKFFVCSISYLVPCTLPM